MSRIHVHIAVQDLQGNIDFYSALFGAPPVKIETNYAKWQLEDPRLNFAISTQGRAPGLDHIGIQAESAEELSKIEARIQNAGLPGEVQKGTTCCYAKSDKYWTRDPQGIAWESFHTLGDAAVFSQSVPSESLSSCCAPEASSDCRR